MRIPVKTVLHLKFFENEELVSNHNHLVKRLYGWCVGLDCGFSVTYIGNICIFWVPRYEIICHGMMSAANLCAVKTS